MNIQRNWYKNIIKKVTKFEQILLKTCNIFVAIKIQIQ